MPHITLDIPEESLLAIKELAEITGVKEGNDPVAQFIQEAVQTYEWLIYQQVNEKTVAVLEPSDIQVLQNSSDVHGERDFIKNFFSPSLKPKADEHFKKAA